MKVVQAPVASRRRRCSKVIPRVSLLLAAALLGGCLGDVAGPTNSTELAAETAPTQSLQDVLAEVESGVVKLTTEACGGGQGSGFLVDDRLIATAAHVVEGSERVTVHLGAFRTDGTVVATDAERDLALVELEEPAAGHVFALEEDAARAGDTVAAIGYPLGLPRSVSVGTVSGTIDELIDGSNVAYVQTDTAVNPGNSGGPLVTDSGSVIGVIDLKLVDTEGLGFAVSADDLAAHIDDWRAGRAQGPASCPEEIALPPEFAPHVESAPWDGPPADPPPGLGPLINHVVEWNKLPPDCALIAPTAMDQIGWVPDSAAGVSNSRLGDYLQYGWDPQDGAGGAWIFVWPNGNRNIERFFEPGVEETAYSDGSIRRSLSVGSHLLAIAGEECFYEISMPGWCTVCAGHFWTSLRRIELDVRPVGRPEEAVEGYFAAVNEQDWARAYLDHFSQRRRSGMTIGEFTDQMASSSVDALALSNAIVDGDTATIEVTFRSRQSPDLGPNGQECSLWTLSYSLIREDRWRIDAARNIGNSPEAC